MQIGLSFLCTFSENLEHAPSPKVIPHDEIGRYFGEYCDTHYLANQELAQQYPEDVTATVRTAMEKYTTV